MKLKNLAKKEDDPIEKAKELIEKNYPDVLPKKSDVKPSPIPRGEMPKPVNE